MTGPTVGEMVCNCRMEHVRIRHVDDDGDSIITENGWRGSYVHCCDAADHEWKHEDEGRQ
jgi:hypothetical protein